MGYLSLLKVRGMEHTLDLAIAIKFEALKKLAIVLMDQEVTRERFQRVFAIQEDYGIALFQEILGRSGTTTTTTGEE